MTYAHIPADKRSFANFYLFLVSSYRFSSVTPYSESANNFSLLAHFSALFNYSLFHVLNALPWQFYERSINQDASKKFQWSPYDNNSHSGIKESELKWILQLENKERNTCTSLLTRAKTIQAPRENYSTCTVLQFVPHMTEHHIIHQNYDKNCDILHFTAGEKVADMSRSTSRER